MLNNFIEMNLIVSRVCEECLAWWQLLVISHTFFVKKISKLFSLRIFKTNIYTDWHWQVACSFSCNMQSFVTTLSIGICDNIRQNVNNDISRFAYSETGTEHEERFCSGAYRARLSRAIKLLLSPGASRVRGAWCEALYFVCLFTSASNKVRSVTEAKGID